MASSSSYSCPCAACKFLRRKCTASCIFAPYFPPEEPQKFINVHRIFGASNITKLLNDLLPHQREDAVSSLAYEAEARIRNPVYGCVATISFLQRQVDRLQKELEAANADLIRYAACTNDISSPRDPSLHPIPNVSIAAAAAAPPQSISGRMMTMISSSSNSSEGADPSLYQTPPFSNFPFLLPWNDNRSGDGSGGGGI